MCNIDGFNYDRYQLWRWWESSSSNVRAASSFLREWKSGINNEQKSTAAARAGAALVLQNKHILEQQLDEVVKESGVMKTELTRVQLQLQVEIEIRIDR